MDSAIREELEGAYGEGSTDILSKELESELVTGSKAPTKVTKKMNLEQVQEDNSNTSDEHKADEDVIMNESEASSRKEQAKGTPEKTPQKSFTEADIGKKAQPAANSATSPSANALLPSKNVSFAEAVTNNSHSLRKGNLSTSSGKPIVNPYSKNIEEGTLHVRKPIEMRIARLDKNIVLKKKNLRPHTHRYTLRFKTNASKSEEDGHQRAQETLQRFLDIVLQADPKTIIPPYLELDRDDKSITDISSAFPISSIDSYHALKKYFFRLSPRDEEGISWCSIILAQALPFSVFMDKAKYSLENSEFSLWAKASDNENTTDAGWLLYSTRAKDEERLSALLSSLTGEYIGVKWKPIRASSGNIRRKDQAAPEEKIKALHVECAVDRLQ
jgi:hypothetical protein